MKISAVIEQIKEARKQGNLDLFYNLLNELEYYSKYLNEGDDKNETLLLSTFDVLYLENLYEQEVIDESFGLDYNLELFRRKKIINEKSYPYLLKFISLPKEKDKGLHNENHGMGYHIHYLIMQRGKPERTNVIFTFRKTKIINNSDPNLFWEYHGGGLEKYPDKFKQRRRKAIYDTSCSFLRKIAVEEFKSPGKESSLLWPNSI